jgi:hypothetical protein
MLVYLILVSCFQQLAQDCQILQERLDEVTVQYMSLEDVIEEKESLIKMMRAKVKELEERASTISVLQYQVTFALCNR